MMIELDMFAEHLTTSVFLYASGAILIAYAIVALWAVGFGASQRLQPAMDASA